MSKDWLTYCVYYTKDGETFTKKFKSLKKSRKYAFDLSLENEKTVIWWEIDLRRKDKRYEQLESRLCR